MIYRARRMPRLEIRPSARTPPGVFFICTKGGRGGAERTRTRAVPEILHWRTRPNFFGQIFWEKILEIKIVLFSIPEERVLRVGRSDSARSDSGPGTVIVTHAATPPVPRPPASLAKHRRVAGSGEHGVDAIAIAASRVGS
jgi:hypothetical protein